MRIRTSAFSCCDHQALAFATFSENFLRLHSWYDSCTVGSKSTGAGGQWCVRWPCCELSTTIADPSKIWKTCKHSGTTLHIIPPWHFCNQRQPVTSSQKWIGTNWIESKGIPIPNPSWILPVSIKMHAQQQPFPLSLHNILSIIAITGFSISFCWPAPSRIYYVPVEVCVLYVFTFQSWVMMIVQ